MMKSPYRMLVALVLFAALSTTTFGEEHGIVEKWRCFDKSDFFSGKVVVELTRKKIPQGEVHGDGEVSTSGIVYQAWFRFDGLERRWDFDDYKYSIVIDPNGNGGYYDFSGIKWWHWNKSVQASASYHCVSP